jgi:Histidine kinase
MPTMPTPARLPDTATPAQGERRLWLAYAGLCALSWALYAMAGTDWQRDGWRVLEGAYEATWNLGPPMLLGGLGLPWARFLARRSAQRAPGLLPRLAWHVAGALAFVLAWQALDFASAWWFFGVEHALATFEQRVLWRAMWGVFVYVALVLGFGGALAARSAHRAALAAARAEAALVRAELAAISGKLNPHFLFNTLNSLIMLTRRDPAAAEATLLRFSRMMRYVLDTSRGAADRVTLQEELDFVRDYLELEALRLGSRLRVEWLIDAATLASPIPPLTLQPLVENSIVHGISPQLEGGTVRIEAQQLMNAGRPETLALRVADDGAGCTWPPVAGPRAGTQAGSGVGLGALRRRFELDFGGRAQLSVQSSPGAGFRVEILIPCSELT